MDKYIIDTSSLLALVRYYDTFDSRKKLYRKIEEMFVEKRFLLINNVLKESGWVANGVILKTYRFLNLKKKITPIKSHTPISNELHKKIDQDWVIQKNKKVNNLEYEEAKTREVEERADFQLVFTAMDIKAAIVTEESKSMNDQKLFKKIPLICEHEKIPCIALPEMLQKVGIGIEYKTK